MVDYITCPPCKPYNFSENNHTFLLLLLYKIIILPMSLLLTCPLNKGIKLKIINNKKTHIYLLLQTKQIKGKHFLLSFFFSFFLFFFPYPPYFQTYTKESFSFSFSFLYHFFFLLILYFLFLPLQSNTVIMWHICS